MGISPSRGGRSRFSAFTTLASVVWMSAVPAMVFAQSAIAGVVRDSSGAVVPDVLVTVSSTALIEKFRSTVTDGSGVNRVEVLSPGDSSETLQRTAWTSDKR